MTSQDITSKHDLSNTYIGIDLRNQNVTIVVNKCTTIKGSTFDPSIDTRPKLHHKGCKRTFLTLEKTKR